MPSTPFRGVTETVSGYAGGTKPNPTMATTKVIVEAVKVTYDPAKVTYAKLLDHFGTMSIRSIRKGSSAIRPCLSHRNLHR